MDKLRAIVDPGRGRKSGSDTTERAHGVVGGESGNGALEAPGVPTGSEPLAGLRKGDSKKILVAVLLRERTSVGNVWLVQRLEMGHLAR